MLRDVQHASPLSGATQRRLRQYAIAKMRSFRTLAAALDGPHDRDELAGTFAATWLELRFEWERHNRAANYQLASVGRAEPRIVAWAALCSALLAWLEDTIPVPMRERVTAMSSAVLDAAADVGVPVPASL